MKKTTLLFAFTIAALAVAQAADNQKSCRVTQAPVPEFVPPAPFPGPPADRFYLGTKELWASLWAGPWHGLPTDQGYRVKFPWFAVDIGREETERAAISVTGRRLDAPAGPLLVEGPNVGMLPDYSFYASALVFPTEGCWEITAKGRDRRLTFVVWVSK